ncbi:MAG: hypothetical protein ACK5OQ_14695, partial [Burkholderiales bacterium]
CMNRYLPMPPNVQAIYPSRGRSVINGGRRISVRQGPSTSTHQSHLQMDGLAQNCLKMPVVAGVLSFRQGRSEGLAIKKMVSDPNLLLTQAS